MNVKKSRSFSNIYWKNKIILFIKCRTKLDIPTTTRKKVIIYRCVHVIYLLRHHSDMKNERKRIQIGKKRLLENFKSIYFSISKCFWMYRTKNDECSWVCSRAIFFISKQMVWMMWWKYVLFVITRNCYVFLCFQVYMYTMITDAICFL